MPTGGRSTSPRPDRPGSLGAMTEWDDEDQLEGQDEGGSAFARPEDTGLERVDAVLARMATVTELPLEEQVQVFEAAHAELRGALDAPGT